MTWHISAEGWLFPATHCPSPNCDFRPENSSIDLLVIHNISLPPNEFGGNFVCDLFLNQLDKNAHPYFAEIAHIHVSAHLWIRRDGQVIQFVPFGMRAWHAGKSYWQGRERCNDFSIGIELEGADHIAYTPQQYQVLSQITQILLHAYPNLALPYGIAGHSDIAPERKTDPGIAFDWAYYKNLIFNPL